MYVINHKELTFDIYNVIVYSLYENAHYMTMDKTYWTYSVDGPSTYFCTNI